jgi:hypothetical protein
VENGELDKKLAELRQEFGTVHVAKP